MSINFFTKLICERYKDGNNIPHNIKKSRIIARLVMRAKNAVSAQTEGSMILYEICDKNTIKNILSRRDAEYNEYLLNNTNEYLNTEYEFAEQMGVPF